VVTPIHPELIKYYLVGYDKPSTNFLFTGFTQGIRIPYEGNRKFRFNRNLPSATTKVDILKQKNSKEVTAGRASGLFVMFYQNNADPLVGTLRAHGHPNVSVLF
jgi:hypothetical protein